MIKVTLGNEPKKDVKDFPKLMIAIDGWAKGGIVFFEKPSCGLQISSPDKGINPGWADNWLMKHFTDYNEPITIQNA